jgi:hypothetical protein
MNLFTQFILWNSFSNSYIPPPSLAGSSFGSPSHVLHFCCYSTSSFHSPTFSSPFIFLLSSPYIIPTRPSHCPFPSFWVIPSPTLSLLSLKPFFILSLSPFMTNQMRRNCDCWLTPAVSVFLLVSVFALYSLSFPFFSFVHYTLSLPLFLDFCSM